MNRVAFLAYREVRDNVTAPSRHDIADNAAEHPIDHVEIGLTGRRSDEPSDNQQRAEIERVTGDRWAIDTTMVGTGS